MSWWTNQTLGAFELHTPWWISGESGAGHLSICAAIRAETKAAVREIVYGAYDTRPDYIEFRFCEERPAGWEPFNSRFQRAAWMVW